MKKTVIFINFFRYDRLNYHKFYNKEKYRFIIFLNDEFYKRFPKEYLHMFDKLICINKLEFNEFYPYIEEEVSFLQNKSNLSIVCWDEQMLLIASQLRKKFGLNGALPDKINLFRDKILMKNALNNKKIKVPNYKKFNGKKLEIDTLNIIANEIGFPMIVKPIDGSGSMETKKINNFVELCDFSKIQSNIDNFECEEFVEGEFYHCDCLIDKGRIIFEEVSKYIGSGIDFLNGKPIGSFILNDENLIRKEIISFNNSVIEVLDPPDGFTHMEVFHNGKEVIFIEIACRPPGGEIMPMYYNSYGIDFYEILMQKELDLLVEIKPIRKKFAAWIYYPKRNGIVKKISQPKLKSTTVMQNKVQIDDAIVRSSNCYERAISVEIINDSYYEIIDDIKNLSELCLVEYI